LERESKRRRKIEGKKRKQKSGAEANRLGK